MTRDADGKLVRGLAPTIMASRDGLEIVGRDGSLRRIEGPGAALAEAVLAWCEVPRSRSEILAHVERASGAPLGDGAEVVAQVVDLLVGAGALVLEVPRSPSRTTSSRVLVGLGGAVAAAHAPVLVQALVGMGHEVRVAATERALRFVSREALEALVHAPVHESMWPTDPSAALAGHVPHVELARWAEVVALWPATASMIGRVATGDTSELVSAVAITTRAPVLVAPSMNEAMLDASAIARNLRVLRDDGFHVVLSAHAHEVADAPSVRRPARGGAPDPIHVARMIDALARSSVRVPRDPASWEAYHRRVAEVDQPWTDDAPDPAVVALLRAHAPAGATVWDVGTGHGAIALAAAAAGYRVLATDCSETALARARARPGSASVVWIRDDVTRSDLRTDVDVVVDRGTLHVLPPADRPAYAEALAARTRAGGIALVTVHTPPGDAQLASFPMTAEEVAAILAPAFELSSSVPGTFAGRRHPAPASVSCVLRRR